MLRTVGEVFGVFVISITALFAFYMLATKHATGIGWVHWKGVVLIGVGVLYIVCGTILIGVGRHP